jgi:histidine triad (HIT) family protein
MSKVSSSNVSAMYVKVGTLVYLKIHVRLIAKNKQPVYTQASKHNMSKLCIFCSIIAGQEPSVYIYRDNSFLVLMDKYPINPGHTLVMPIRHYETLLQMPPAEVAKLYSLVPAIAKAIVSAVKADGFNVGQNNGVAANQIVPHVHVHIVPRFLDDSPDGKWPARKVCSQEDLVVIAHKIRQEISLVHSH